jgi:hypothetical protein
LGTAAVLAGRPPGFAKSGSPHEAFSPAPTCRRHWRACGGVTPTNASPDKRRTGLFAPGQHRYRMRLVPKPHDVIRRGPMARPLRQARTVRRTAFVVRSNDWAGNETHFPRELAEHALAHVIAGKAKQSYRRSERWRGRAILWKRGRGIPKVPRATTSSHSRDPCDLSRNQLVHRKDGHSARRFAMRHLAGSKALNKHQRGKP